MGCILYRAMTLTVEFVPELKPEPTLWYSMSDFDRTTFFVPAPYVETVITPHMFASPASYSLPTGRDTIVTMSVFNSLSTAPFVL